MVNICEVVVEVEDASSIQELVSPSHLRVKVTTCPEGGWV